MQALENAIDFCTNNCYLQKEIEAKIQDMLYSAKKQLSEDYIELPKDKNGKTIHIGDEVKSDLYKGGIVTSISCYKENSPMLLVNPDIIYRAADYYEVLEPDSIEKISEDANKTVCQYFVDSDYDEVPLYCNNCRANSRDNSKFRFCYNLMAHELLIRQQKLIGEE